MNDIGLWQGIGEWERIDEINTFTKTLDAHKLWYRNYVGEETMGPFLKTVWCNFGEEYLLHFIYGIS